jgi:hypothetical protein
MKIVFVSDPPEYVQQVLIPALTVSIAVVLCILEEEYRYYIVSSRKYR